MGRTLSYCYLNMNKEEYVEKKKKSDIIANEHIRIYGWQCECEDCNRSYCKNFDDYSLISIVSSCSELPYFEVYTHKELEDYLIELVNQKLYYEIAIIALLLDRFPRNSKICIIKYD